MVARTFFADPGKDLLGTLCSNHSIWQGYQQIVALLCELYAFSHMSYSVSAIPVCLGHSCLSLGWK